MSRPPDDQIVTTPPPMRPELTLIACSATKLQRPALARELYRGRLFRLAVQWAELAERRWVVLSAKYGAVDPNQVLGPYDMRMPTRAEAVMSWIRRVNADVWSLAPYGRLWLLCGRQYAQAFQGPLHDKCFPDGGRPFRLELPLAGLGIGQQQAWLNREIRKQLRARSL